MLCQRCSSLLKATGPAVAKPQAAKRALSVSSRFHGPVAAILPAATSSHLRPRLQATHTSSMRSSIRSSFHTSPASQTPAPSSSAADPGPDASAKAPEKPDFLDEAESVIWDRLVKELNPVELVVQDISGGCGSMYGIEIASEKFRGANMLKQQRMVNAVLGDLLKGWHGCQLKTRVP